MLEFIHVLTWQIFIASLQFIQSNPEGMPLLISKGMLKGQLGQFSHSDPLESKENGMGGCQGGGPKAFSAVVVPQSLARAGSTGLRFLGNSGRAWLPDRMGKQWGQGSPLLSDLLHVVSREEAFLAMQSAFPPA